MECFWRVIFSLLFCCIPFPPSLFVVPSSATIALGAKCRFRGFVEFSLIRCASLPLFDFVAGCQSAKNHVVGNSTDIKGIRALCPPAFLPHSQTQKVKRQWGWFRGFVDEGKTIKSPKQLSIKNASTTRENLLQNHQNGEMRFFGLFSPVTFASLFFCALDSNL